MLIVIYIRGFESHKDGMFPLRIMLGNALILFISLKNLYSLTKQLYAMKTLQTHSNRLDVVDALRGFALLGIGAVHFCDGGFTRAEFCH